MLGWSTVQNKTLPKYIFTQLSVIIKAKDFAEFMKVSFFSWIQLKDYIYIPFVLSYLLLLNCLLKKKRSSHWIIYLNFIVKLTSEFVVWKGLFSWPLGYKLTAAWLMKVPWSKDGAQFGQYDQWKAEECPYLIFDLKIEMCPRCHG